MKISKKTVIKLCIIIPILALVLWFIQKPVFFIYHSYAVETENGDIPLTDEQFKQIAKAYKNDYTLHYEWLGGNYGGYTVKLYKTKDMSGKYNIMDTGDIQDMFLHINGKNKRTWSYRKPDTHRQVNAIIEEAINQYESEQEA